jgi:hypothetical protein
MRANEHDATQTDRRECDRPEPRHGEAAIESSGLGSFGMRKVCSDGCQRQEWIVVIECQACTDTLGGAGA